MDRCEYVCRHYGVPADIGRIVIVDGRSGVIAKDRGNYIGVNFDDDKPGVISCCHPTWRVEYGEMGETRKMTRSQWRYREYLDSAYFDAGDSFAKFLGIAGA